MTRLLICLLLFGLLHAAEPTGTLAGSILDPAGAVVPAAKVSVVNTQTGLKREMPSGTDEEFRIPAPAGRSL
ncbi:MAG: carboxypeptidase-like regulatory domain-containing protein [Paludibaculum sp.]